MAKNIKKRKNGSYSCIVYLKDPLTGKTKPRWKSGFHSEKDAEKERIRWTQEINEGKYSLDSEMKLSAYLALWLETKKNVLKPGTSQGYAVNIKNHIVPYIGSKKLNEITPIMLEALYSRLSKVIVKSTADGEKYLSASSIRYVHATLRAALNDAVKKRILPFNPCYSVTLAARNKYVARTLTQDEIKAFLNACDGSPIGLELTLMLMLGLRRGEALGLRFSDIDFERRIAHIQQQYTTCGKDKTGKPQWGIRSLKTKESDRIIGIPSLVLQKLIERQKVAKHDLVCCNDDGSPRNINSLEHAFKMFLAQNGLPEIRLHDLRHTYATQLRDLGVDITTISQVLGHTSIKTTADIYISRNSAAASLAAKAIDDWI